MTSVRLEPAAPQSRVKHSTTEPLHSLQPTDDVKLKTKLCHLNGVAVDDAVLLQNRKKIV